MASLCKKCRCSRDQWDTCAHTWLIRRRVGGKEVYANVGPDHGAAKRALARLSAVPEETVSQALDLWLATKAHGRANSIKSYRTRVAHIRAYFGNDTLRSLREEDLTRFAADLLAERYRPATVHGIYRTLTGTLRHAQRRGALKHLPLPIGGPGIPRAEPRVHQLTLGQVEEVIARMPGVWGQVAELVLLTGLRWGEVVAVTEEDVEGSSLHVRRTRAHDGTTNPPKTRSGERIVPLSPRAVKILAELDLPVEGDYRDARNHLVQALGPLHRPGMGWHSFRAAHATLLDSAGVSLRDSAARMGHGHSFATTLAYHVASEAGDADVIDLERERRERRARRSV